MFRSCDNTLEACFLVNMAISAAVGIDLGTTFSCVGVYENGHVTIIENEEGSRTTPSWVAFPAAGGVVVGEQAKRQSPDNTQNSIFEIKRLIGRKYVFHTNFSLSFPQEVSHSSPLFCIFQVVRLVCSIRHPAFSFPSLP